MHTAIAKIVRVSLTSTITPKPFSRFFHSNIHGNGVSQTLLNALKLKLHRSVPNPFRNLISLKSHHFPARNFHISGGKSAVSVLLGLSVVIGSWPRVAHCTDGLGLLAYYRDYSVSGYSELEDDEDHRALGIVLRKILLPSFLLATILMNWGQPIVIAAKIFLILYGSNPSPFSVYFVIEQLRKQAIRQRPIVFRYRQPCFAKKVEVEDFVFFCLAKAELNDQNITLVGILGGWWVLPLAS